MGRTRLWRACGLPDRRNPRTWAEPWRGAADPVHLRHGPCGFHCRSCGALCCCGIRWGNHCRFDQLARHRCRGRDRLGRLSVDPARPRGRGADRFDYFIWCRHSDCHRFSDCNCCALVGIRPEFRSRRILCAGTCGPEPGCWPFGYLACQRHGRNGHWSGDGNRWPGCSNRRAALYRQPL